LWLVLATAGDRKLAQTVEYLKAENAILRTKLPKRITLTDQEKNRLVKFGSKLGPAIRSVITIVSPRTFLRWLTNEDRSGERRGTTKAKPGRPRTSDAIRELILRFAKENCRGYSRIIGKFAKLSMGEAPPASAERVPRALPRGATASVARQPATESANRTRRGRSHLVYQRSEAHEGRVPRTARRLAEVVFSRRGVSPNNRK
jgi:putative transposase